ncbi:DUF6527 family protein [Micromonospora phytophila]|uniref:DUF6527 family protein n=1 Tax=Micromonospora phytophila TaxID=709888 RepID=UPI0035581BB6
MTRRDTVRHEFVDYVPSELADGTIYISVEYATAVHACCCGCGHKVVTPLHPAQWKLTFDGESISLDPSVGNWNLPCSSHYWIRRNRVRWAGAWNEDRIATGRRRDRLALQGAVNDTLPPVVRDCVEPVRQPLGRLKRLLRRIRRRDGEASSQTQ